MIICIYHLLRKMKVNRTTFDMLLSNFFYTVIYV
nr:MAG TPA: hypothetical protein [Caudoviricetes sp.]